MISKILTLLAMPLGFGGILILVGALASLWRRRGLGVGLALAGLLWIWLWALPVVSDRIRLSLEGRYDPLPMGSLPTAEAVLVLGGSVRGVAAPRQFPDLNAAADRVWHGARLFHAGKAPLVILSGGQLTWNTAEGPEAQAMLRFLVDLGVPEERVLLEAQSGTTYENAQESWKLLAARGIQRVLLVTSALHMRRAEATFRAAGIDVIPAPTDYEVLAEPQRTLLDFLPDAGALDGSTRALHEYLGLVMYRWRGWAK